MAKILLIQEDRLRSIINDAVASVVAEAAEIELPGFSPIRTTEDPPRPAEDPPAVASARPKVRRRYKISPGGFSYADVIWKEYPEKEFSFGSAWEAVKEVINTQAKMPRALARRSMDNDSRFERLGGRPGVWYRRVDPNQPEIEF